MPVILTTMGMALTTADNCPSRPNPDQADLDEDGLGDVCDPDRDGDGIDNQFDNCPAVPNPAQANVDLRDDGGDACDPVTNPPAPNCAAIFDPALTDFDQDGLNDHCDRDRDGDGVFNIDDNCPQTPNPQQINSDGDNRGGDACDDDDDDDGILIESTTARLFSIPTNDGAMPPAQATRAYLISTAMAS